MEQIKGFIISPFYCSVQCCCIIHIYLLFTLVCNGACKIDIIYITSPFVSISRGNPLYCFVIDTPLKVMHRDVQGDNDKKTNHRYPKNITITQDASNNTSNHITVTKDAPTNRSNCTDKGTDSYFELVLKSGKDHIASLEKQLMYKQYIIEELLRKSYQTSRNYTIAKNRRSKISYEIYRK